MYKLISQETLSQPRGADYAHQIMLAPPDFQTFLGPWDIRPRAVVSGGAGGALAPPEFGSSINPIPAREADYAHHITGSTPGFENLTTAL